MDFHNCGFHTIRIANHLTRTRICQLQFCFSWGLPPENHNQKTAWGRVEPSGLRARLFPQCPSWSALSPQDRNSEGPNFCMRSKTQMIPATKDFLGKLDSRYEKIILQTACLFTVSELRHFSCDYHDATAVRLYIDKFYMSEACS